MKILLTGATGFLGSHLIPAILAAGHEVSILRRSFSDTRRIKGYLDKVQSLDVDVEPIERPFEECGRFDCVVHTATNYGRQGETATKVFEATAKTATETTEIFRNSYESLCGGTRFPTIISFFFANIGASAEKNMCCSFGYTLQWYLI